MTLEHTSTDRPSHNREVKYVYDKTIEIDSTEKLD